MTWIHDFIIRIWKWFSNRLFQSYQTILVENDIPKNLSSKTIYIVQEEGYLWSASMLCPCGCGEALHMNLIPDERPCWRLTKHQDGTISLHPSIWRKKGCCAHFWFKKGKVKWT
jgi:hypothetical protein